MKVDVSQVLYALERQRDALDAQAERLGRELDYSAEFPAADADRMREAIELLFDRDRLQTVVNSVRAWPIAGVRVEDDKVIVAVKGGNAAARRLCGELLSTVRFAADQAVKP